MHINNVDMSSTRSRISLSLPAHPATTAVIKNFMSRNMEKKNKKSTSARKNCFFAYLLI